MNDDSDHADLDLKCHICYDYYSDEENGETQPLILSCRCKLTLCRGCIVKRLATTALCPYCEQRWSIRNFIQQCELATPKFYHREIVAKATTNVNKSPVRLEGNRVPLGAGTSESHCG